MDAAAHLQLMQVLHSRRDAIADDWYRATVPAACVPPDGQVRQRVNDLTEQIITLMLTDPMDRDAARSIGVALAHLHYLRAESLAATLQVLAQQLIAEAPAEQAMTLYPRLTALLSELAAGFTAQAIETLHTEQEQIRRALDAERLQAQGALQMEELLMRHAQEMAALYKTSLEINSQLDVPKLLEAIVRRAARLVGTQMGALYLIRPDGHTLELVVSHNLPRDYRGVTLRRGEGVAGQVAQTGKPMAIDDYSHWEGRAAAYASASFRRVLGVPLQVGNKVIGVITINDDIRTGPFSEDESRLVSMFADQAAIALENARLYQAERDNRELADTLREVGATLVSTLDTHIVLDRILEQVSRVTPNDVADIMLIEGDTARLAGWRGYERFGTPDLISVTFLVAGTRNLQHMVETGEPMVIQDVHADPHWIHVPGTEQLRSYAGVPIRVRGETIGFLAVYSIIPGHFEWTDAEKLRAFADQAAIAWENARLYEDTRRTAERLQALSHRMVEVQEAERRFIARELHDEIGQTLTAVKINLQALQRSSDAFRQAAILEESVTVIERALQQVRNLSLDLRPSLLDDLGLVPALRWYVNRQAERAGFTAVFTADSLEAHLSPDVEIACFRVAQEALTNVVRHAQAQHVVVELLQRDATVELTIRDDGVGFDVQSALERAMHGASLGMLGMDERVSLVGGQMEIESVPMRGTEIRARFPLASPSSKAKGPPVA